MSSMLTTPADASVTSAVGLVRAALEQLSRVVALGQLEELAGAELLDVTVALHRIADRARAVAVEATSAVRESGSARDVEGFTSMSRWLEVRAGLAPHAARATIASGERLQWEFPSTREAWLAGEVTEGVVREITTAIPRMLRTVPDATCGQERARLERAALATAGIGTVSAVRRVIERLRFVADPAGADAAVLAAHESQYLRFTPVAHGVEVAGFLSTESAALVLTAFDRRVDAQHRAGSPAREASAGLAAATRGLRAGRREHLNAAVLTDLCAHLLGDGMLGSRHAVRPHVCVSVQADDHARGLGGEVLLPGFGVVPVPSTTISRILCDADIHPVLTARPGSPPGLPDEDHPLFVEDLDDDESWLRRLLGEVGQHVLDVGRSYRTAPPKLRRALEVRDRHCAFPGCDVDPSRCEAHHVVHWEHHGDTAIHNLVLLCSRHHHLVHEGGWRIEHAAGVDPGHPDYWSFLAPTPTSTPTPTRAAAPARGFSPAVARG